MTRQPIPENLQADLIEGVLLSELKQISDARGAVLHMLRCDDAAFIKFGECYFSEVLPGEIKAWKCHREQTQNLAVPVGRMRFVIYDQREFSLTRGNLQILELGRPDSYLRLTIPPGLWYGFTCISSSASLVVNFTDLPHHPSESQVREINHPLIPYEWQSVK